VGLLALVAGGFSVLGRVDLHPCSGHTATSFLEHRWATDPHLAIALVDVRTVDLANSMGKAKEVANAKSGDELIASQVSLSSQLPHNL
jgi:hypothetical protein